MISNRHNLLRACFHPSNPSDPIQRQRSALRRSQVLTIKPSNLEFLESSINNPQQQKIKRELDRQSPLIIRRYRPTIENFSPHQQPSNIEDVYGSQLQLTRPPQSASRKKSPRISTFQSKPLQHSKTIHENTIKHISKFSHSLQTPIWSPILTQKIIARSQPSRSKSLLSKPLNTRHQLHSEKKTSISSLFISPRPIIHEGEISKKTTRNDLVDEWEDPKSNVAVLSDDDDSTITSCVHFTSPFSLLNHHPSSLNSSSQRHPYSFCLPPVVEDIDNEIY